MKKKILLKLYIAKKKKGISQAALARAAGISQVTLSQRMNCHFDESGRFNELQKIAIADALGWPQKYRNELFEEYEL